ncbi:hypothetical protein QYE76_053672 [Lolium multiflorum]|uniref:Uncharacterized protein n=1 Tax=Lolium multiflorum TaxID=4521 RepID=A0AAD8WM67_LOLMU|nr:hypothetical protein QYE76_053672 [Lolium multiflorum]
MTLAVRPYHHSRRASWKFRRRTVLLIPERPLTPIDEEGVPSMSGYRDAGDSSALRHEVEAHGYKYARRRTDLFFLFFFRRTPRLFVVSADRSASAARAPTAALVAEIFPRLPPTSLPPHTRNTLPHARNPRAATCAVRTWPRAPRSG